MKGRIWKTRGGPLSFSSSTTAGQAKATSHQYFFRNSDELGTFHEMLTQLFDRELEGDAGRDESTVTTISSKTTEREMQNKQAIVVVYNDAG